MGYSYYRTKPYIFYFLLGILMFYFSLVILQVFYGMHSVEANIYLNYAVSLIEDGDLNVLNNISKAAAWVVTPTYNSPNMHDHGASILWIPYLYIINFLNVSPLKLSDGQEVTQYVAAMFYWSFLSLFFSLKLLSGWIFEKYDVKINNHIFINVLLGTGLFFYTFIAFLSSEIALFTYTVFSLVIIAPQKNRSFWDYFFMGVILSFGLIVKVYYLFFFPLFFFLLIKKKEKRRPFYYLGFGVGFFSIFFLKLMNKLLMYGEVIIGDGYLQEYAFSNIRLKETLTTYFGPIGYFSSTPIILFTIISFLFLIVYAKKKGHLAKRQLLIVLFLVLTGKLVLFEFVFGPAELEFGARHLIVDNIFFLVTLSFLADYIKKYKMCYFYMMVILYLLSGWAILNYCWYIKLEQFVPDQRVVHSIWENFDLARLEFIKIASGFIYILKSIFNPALLLYNFSYFSIAVFIGVLIYRINDLINFILNRRKKIMSCFGGGILALYSIVTFLNYFNNKINSENMKNDYLYKNVTMGNGIHLFTYDNISSDMIARLSWAKYTNDRHYFDLNVKYFKTFLEKARSEIIYDNFGFIKILDEEKIPPSGQIGIDFNMLLLDYEARL